MTTSYQSTRNTTIEGALRIVGVIAEDETPTTEQYNKAAEALNLLIKARMNDGLEQWAMAEVSFPMTTTAAYTIGTGMTINVGKPVRIIQAWRRTVGNVDVPLRIITKDEYNMLGNKTSSGTPIQLSYRPGNMSGTIYLFPTPDSTTVSTDTIFILYQRPFEDLTTGTDVPDFPQEWQDYLKWGLAEALMFEYGVPTNDKKDIKAKSKESLELALSGGTEEGSLYMMPDRRGY